MVPPVRKDEILDALIELYLARGFLGFGIGELAKELRCSRSTLYQVAGSKEQIILVAVRGYFRRATERIEVRVAAEPDGGSRLRVYLEAVSEELAPATENFYADLAAHPPAREVYEANTRLAAQRVQDIVAAGVAAGSIRPVNARFVGGAVAEVMAAIQTGRIEAATGLDDAEAYRTLADLVHRAVAVAP